MEVRTALGQARVSTEIVKAFAGNVTQARRLLERSQQGSELGVRTRLEVEDALLNARQAEARRDDLIAHADLR